MFENGREKKKAGDGDESCESDDGDKYCLYNIHVCQLLGKNGW
jgi:hypothetical protein